MSKVKHTPGPWAARKGDVFNGDRTWGIVRFFSLEECQEVDGEDATPNSRTEVIAEVLSADDGVDEADAKLMAAAPELYSALRLMLEKFQYDVRPGEAGSDAIEAARSAIYKVEGK